jgi:hypothetical protein
MIYVLWRGCGDVAGMLAGSCGAAWLGILHQLLHVFCLGLSCAKRLQARRLLCLLTRALAAMSEVPQPTVLQSLTGLVASCDMGAAFSIHALQQRVWQHNSLVGVDTTCA